jgi:hypothetical protein
VREQGSAEVKLLDHASAEVAATCEVRIQSVLLWQLTDGSMTAASQATTTRLVSLFMPSLSLSEPGRNTRFSQSDKAVKYAQKYKLVFSLLNEDIGEGGIAQWEATEALESTCAAESAAAHSAVLLNCIFRPGFVLSYRLCISIASFTGRFTHL